MMNSSVKPETRPGRCPSGAWRSKRPQLLASAFAALLSAVGASGAAHAQEFVLPSNGDSVVGGLQWVNASHEDTLLDIARRYDVGYREIRLANPGVDVWLPGEGTGILIPSRYILPDAPREGIVINLSEMRLYYYPKSGRDEPRRVITHPISVGRVGWGTPLADTRIVTKLTDPTWYPPESIRADHAAKGDPLPAKVPPGPDNPLGRFALRLALPGYLIHGTKKPYGIGMRVSYGCIRLYPEDIETLFKSVRVDTPVHIINQPYKAGWRQGVLFFEAHPPEGNPTPGMLRDLTPAVRSVVDATPKRAAGTSIDWQRVHRIAEAMPGIPLPLSKNGLQANERAPDPKIRTAGESTASP